MLSQGPRTQAKGAFRLRTLESNGCFVPKVPHAAHDFSADQQLAVDRPIFGFLWAMY